ncbi:hypothetical protein K439DRAFT_1235113, partial [Ramaria rubella]
PTTFTAPGTSVQDSRSLAIRIKWEQLMDSLTRDRANPSRVWNAYLELGNVMGFETIPHQVQQQVLRKSVPSTEQLRVSAARRMQAGNRPSTPHIYESRLQTVIAHIRNKGRKPEMEDYNFILGQFAAVGHQTGARQVFHEMIHLGVKPSFRTYGLCLQTIAHRLTLPCPYRFQKTMFVEASQMCAELLDDMWTRHIPLTSVNFDLVHRIFKETSDRATFDKLLKVGYGIDLAYPDRLPLDVQGSGVLLGVPNSPEFKNFKLLPFSTAALNTLIDMLGSTKQISRMVSAYEVLTAPLPTSMPNSSSSGQWLDEDDEDEPTFAQSSSSDPTPLYKFPSANPNTTTFKLLIRYTSKAKHAVLARHYVVLAMERDRMVDAQLRADLSSKPLGEIISPNFAVNRGTFLPPYGLANRTRHFGFMRWCYGKTVEAWKIKKEDLAFYTEWQQKNIIPFRDGPSVHSDMETDSPPPSDSLSTPRGPWTPQLPEALLLDLDAPSPSQIEKKLLDLDRHIMLLTRDVQEMGELVARLEEGVRRLSQRTKERLGRRIWQGKDIFLVSRNKRVHLGRKEWIEHVGFVTPRQRL